MQTNLIAHAFKTYDFALMEAQFLISERYRARSKYTPQTQRMRAYQPPVDQNGYLVGFGTTHAARKLRQQHRRIERAQQSAA